MSNVFISLELEVQIKQKKSSRNLAKLRNESEELGTALFGIYFHCMAKKHLANFVKQFSYVPPRKVTHTGL